MNRDAFEALERRWETLTLNRYLDEDEREEDALGEEDETETAQEPILFPHSHAHPAWLRDAAA